MAYDDTGPEPAPGRTTGLLAALWWPSGKLTGYLGIGAIAALVVRHKIKTRPRLFPATLSEFGKDRERLTSRS